MSLASTSLTDVLSIDGGIMAVGRSMTGRTVKSVYLKPKCASGLQAQRTDSGDMLRVWRLKSSIPIERHAIVPARRTSVGACESCYQRVASPNWSFSVLCWRNQFNNWMSACYVTLTCSAGAVPNLNNHHMHHSGQPIRHSHPCACRSLEPQFHVAEQFQFQKPGCCSV